MNYKKYITENKLNEGLADKFITELKTLIKNIQSGQGVDKKSFETMTDGELLASFLKGGFQSALLNLSDIKGFKKGFKI